jgi:hypothetical protein
LPFSTPVTMPTTPHGGRDRMMPVALRSRRMTGSRATAIAIAAAPAAPSRNQPSCAADGTGTECQPPGNVEINDSPRYWSGEDHLVPNGANP